MYNQRHDIYGLTSVRISENGNQGGSVYGTEVALVSQGTDTGEPFHCEAREKEDRRLFGVWQIYNRVIPLSPVAIFYVFHTNYIESKRNYSPKTYYPDESTTVDVGELKQAN